ncbi:hypothetical protein CLOP_g17559 [Closterium sp. NIES-67]|nr:hypothetical protein CLOP_g17559 [Closterium sp. NIES-67]
MAQALRCSTPLALSVTSVVAAGTQRGQGESRPARSRSFASLAAPARFSSCRFVGGCRPVARRRIHVSSGHPVASWTQPSHAQRIVSSIKARADTVTVDEPYSEAAEAEEEGGNKAREPTEEAGKAGIAGETRAEEEGGKAEASAASGAKLSQATLIWRAVKLPIYSVALIPLMIGASAAYLQTGVFHAARFGSFLLFSVLVIAWLNLSNDGFDSFTGVDKTKPESVVNLTGSRFRVLAAAFLLLGIGLAGIISGAAAVADPRVGWLLAASIACGYVYQCPPFRLSYKGLGEPLCFFAFGPLATTASTCTRPATPGRLQPCHPRCWQHRCWWASPPRSSSSARTSTRSTVTGPRAKCPLWCAWYSQGL